MTMKLFCKSIADGVIHSGVLALLLNFVLSVYSQNFSTIIFILLSALCAIFVATVSFLSLLRENSNNAIILFCVNSFVISAATIVLCLALKIRLFPLRETNSADGILLLMITGVFSFLSFALKFSIILLFVIRNITQRGTWDKRGRQGTVLCPHEEKSDNP